MSTNTNPVPVTAEDLLLKAQVMEWPMVLFNGSRTVDGEASWRRALESALPGELAEIALRLEALRPDFLRRSAFEDAEFQREEERRNPPPPDPEWEARRCADNEDLRKLAARDAGPSTYAQTERLIRAVEEVCAVMRARR